MRIFIRAYQWRACSVLALTRRMLRVGRVNFLRSEQGNASIAGILFALILLALAAAIVDIYRIQDIRTFAYGAANDAALVGVSHGRDWNAFTATGQMSLNPIVAHASARNVLGDLMARRGLHTYTYQIEVLTNPNDVALDFPPVPRASLFCPSGPCAWTENRPAVGVYVAATIPTILFGIINGNRPIVVHVFVAAKVVEQ